MARARAKDDGGTGDEAPAPFDRGATRCRPLVIVHLMKTGGTSLLQQVFANVARTAIWGAPGPGVGSDAQLAHYTSLELLRGLDPDDRASLEVVVGHLPFAAVDVCGFGDVTIATIVREPVERVVSHLRMCQAANPEHRELPIEAIYEDEYFRTRLFRNHQTKMLGMSSVDATTPPPRMPAGPPNPAVVEALVAEGYFGSARHVFDRLDTPLVWPITVDAATLDRACGNLERVDVLGLHDEYDEFLDRLARTTGWTIDRDIRANLGAPVVISPSFRRRVEEDNALDAELHDHARRLVSRR